MPPKTSQVDQSAGFITKKEDFPSLSPVGASTSSGVVLQERTARLELSQADLARRVDALHEGLQQLVLQIGDLIKGFSAAQSSTSRVSSTPPDVADRSRQFSYQESQLRHPGVAPPERATRLRGF